VQQEKWAALPRARLPLARPEGFEPPTCGFEGGRGRPAKSWRCVGLYRRLRSRIRYSRFVALLVLIALVAWSKMANESAKPCPVPAALLSPSSRGIEMLTSRYEVATRDGLGGRMHLRYLIGSYARVFVRATLTLYAALAFASIIHESGHGLVAVMGGAELRGYRVSPLLRDGWTEPAYPYVELSAYLPMLTSLGGPVTSLLVGIVALTCTARWRRSWFLVVFTLANLGGLSIGVLALGVSGRAVFAGDIAYLGGAYRASMGSVRLVSVMLGGAGSLAIGIWSCRKALGWTRGALLDTSYRDRLIALIVSCWAPCVAIGILTSLDRTVPVGAAASWSSVFVLAIVLLVARRPASTFTWSNGLRADDPRAVVGAALLAVAACLCVIWVGRTWSPDRQFSAVEIAAWVDRSPNDPKRLRQAAYWSSVSGHADETQAYRERAAGVGPDDAGALFDLGVSYRLAGRTDEALALFEKAARLRPDLDAIPGHVAKIEEERGRYRQAAELWRKCAHLKEQRSPRSNSVEDDTRVLLDRARRLEEKANEHDARAEAPVR
jgi:hypothetical protein